MKSYKDFQKAADMAMKEMSVAATQCAEEITAADSRMDTARESLKEGLLGRKGYSHICDEQNARKQAAKNSLGETIGKAIKAVHEAANEAFTPDLEGISPNAAAVFASVPMTKKELERLIAAHKVEYTIVRACIANGQRGGLDCADNAPMLRKQITETVQQFANYCRSAVNEKGGKDYRDNWGQIVTKHMQQIMKAVAAYEAAPWVTQEVADYSA